MLLLFCCCDLVMSPTLTCTALVKCQEHDLSENVTHSVVTTAHCPPILPALFLATLHSTLCTPQTKHHTTQVYI